MAKIVVCDGCQRSGIVINGRDLLTPWKDRHGNCFRKTFDLCEPCQKKIDAELKAAADAYDSAWIQIINSRGWSGEWCKRKDG